MLFHRLPMPTKQCCNKWSAKLKYKDSRIRGGALETECNIKIETVMVAVLVVGVIMVAVLVVGVIMVAVLVVGVIETTPKIAHLMIY